LQRGPDSTPRVDCKTLKLYISTKDPSIFLKTALYLLYKNTISPEKEPYYICITRFNTEGGFKAKKSCTSPLKSPTFSEKEPYISCKSTLLHKYHLIQRREWAARRGRAHGSR